MNEEVKKMQTYTCFACATDGCKLEVGEDAKKPIACPFGFTRDETRWTKEEQPWKNIDFKYSNVLMLK